MRQKKRRVSIRISALLLAAVIALAAIPRGAVTGVAAGEGPLRSIGTTDYSKIFNIHQCCGSPAAFNGSNIIFGRNSSPSYYGTDQFGHYLSWGGIQSKQKVSLLCDWTLEGTYYTSAPYQDPSNRYFAYICGFSFNSKPGPCDTKPYVWFRFQREFNTSTATMMSDYMPTSGNNLPLHQEPLASWYLNFNSGSISCSYDYSSDTMTFTVGGYSIQETPFRQNMAATMGGTSFYLGFLGSICWDPAMTNDMPDNLQISASFDAFQYNDFDPQLVNMTLYDGTSNTVVTPNAVVAPGTVLRVESVIKNKSSSCAGQTFNLHLKNSDDAQNYPTQGINFLNDSTYPVTVNGTKVGQAINGSGGIPLTMVGNTEYKVVYYVKVTESNGQAVKLGQMLEDDVFQNKDYMGKTLLNERPLEPLDPDDPASNTQAPGSDYHYTRLPKANENGWNKDDVTVQFFAGDFDQFTITPQTGSAVTLADRESQLYDQEQIYSPTTYQAKDTSTGAVSTKVNDLVKIDKTAPTLSFDQDTGVLTAADGLSGVWRLYRKGTDGQFALVKTFPLTGAAGNQSGDSSQTYTATQNGIYLVEDAAGNRSQPLAVQVSEPPVVERPENPDTPPVGPPLDPGGEPVPEGEEPALDPETGLLHRTIEETVTEVISVSPPLYGGSFDRAVVDGMLAYRYAVPAGCTAQVVVKDSKGTDITAQNQYLDTTKPGGVDIFYTLTDGDGNTTEIILHYRLVKARPPQVDPVDPDAPLPEPEVDPIDPDDPEGPVKAVYKDSLTELIRESGVMDKAAAQALMEERYHFTYPDAAGQSVQVELEDRNGAPIEEIDLTRVGDYLIRYTATDANGNQTVVELSYHLISRVPPVIVPPEDGELVGPTPADPDDPLTPLPDGEEPDPEKPSALLYEDEYTEYIKNSVLDNAAALSWMEERYGASSPVGAALTGSVSLYDSKGNLVGQIDQSRVGDYVLIYTVTDQDGNRVSIKLKYHLISKTPPAVVPSDPDHPLPDPIPLPDPVPGSQKKHWNIKDSLTEWVREEQLDKAAVLDWMKGRYPMQSQQSNGELVYSLLLFDQNGRPAEGIDRSRPGGYTVFFTATDSVGNTTTVQLDYTLKERTADAEMDGPDGEGGGGAGQNGGQGGGGSAGTLPFTGTGRCGVHMLALFIALASLGYTLIKRFAGRTPAWLDWLLYRWPPSPAVRWPSFASAGGTCPPSCWPWRW